MTDREKAVAQFYERRKPLILLVAAILTGVALFLAKDLTLDSELQRLLPESADSVQGLQRLEEAYGREIGRVAVVAQGPEGEQNVEAIDSMAEMLSTHELVNSVEAHRPVEYFRDRRLLYLELADARTVADQIQERIKWEKARANPLFVGVGDEAPPEIDVESIEKKYKSKFNADRYLCDPDKRHCLLFVEPTFPSTKFKKTQTLLDDVRSHFHEHLADQLDQTELTFTGRYVKFFEQQKAVQTDLARGTALALAGILLFLIIYFRSWLYPLIIALPLIASTIWSFGWAEIIFDSLNILTGFLGAVLMGLGIDYGIHIVSSFQEARRGHTAHEALITALEKAGRPSLYAGLTTLAALGSLTYSSFRAFFEFGVLALGGLTLILLSYALVLPCLLLIVADTDWEPDPRMPADTEHQSVRPEHTRRWGRVAKFALGALALLALIGLPNVDFQSDFRKLMPKDLPAFRIEDKVDEIVEMARPPAVVLVDDQAHARKVQKELRKRAEQREAGDLIGRVVTIFDFVPDEQKAKLELWQQVDEDFEDVPGKRMKKNERLRSFHKELERILEAGPITTDDLPRTIRDRFHRTDDPGKTVVLIQPSKYIHKAHDAMRYVEVTSELPGPNGNGHVAPISQEALLADILDHVMEDTVWLLLIAVSGLLLVSWLAFRDLAHLVRALGTVSVGVLVGTGIIGLLDVAFNFMNMIIWPIWFGLGIDAVFHLSSRVDEAPSDWSSFSHTAGAVFAAFLTTMIGFGSLMISRHRGLASLGIVAVVGLAAILLVALAVHVFFLEPADSADSPTEGPDAPQDHE